MGPSQQGGKVLSAVLAASLVLGAPPARANCEAGAYRIHTVASYAALDDAPRWVLRAESTPAGDLVLAPAASESEEILRRLLRLLTGSEKATFSLAAGDTRCRPDLATLRVERVPERMDGLTTSLRPCLELPANARYAVYDRAARTLTFPAALQVDRTLLPADREALEADLRTRLFAASPRASEGAERAIARDDVEHVAFEHTRIGDEERGLLVSVAVLRLRNLGELLAVGSSLAGGYLEREAVTGKVADFPLVFFRRPGEEPRFVADGSWCGDARLSVEDAAVEDAAVEGDYLGAFDRFSITAAWDTDADAFPDLVLVNGSFLYSVSPTAPFASGGLTVVDYQQGC